MKFNPIAVIAAVGLKSLPAIAAPPLPQTAVVTGKIVDTSGKPVINAFVAAYDGKKNVVSSAHTNIRGEYSLAVPRSALHVDIKGKTFFTQVNANFNRAVTVATTLVPVAHAATEGASVIKNSKGHVVVQSSVLVDSSLAPAGSTKLPAPVDAQKMPGALMVKAVAPGCTDMIAVTQAYWIQEETAPDANSEQGATVVGWLDPLVMSRASSKKVASIATVSISINSAFASPSLVKHGDTFRISAMLTLPQDPKIYPIVVARDAVSNLIWELHPVGKGQYSAEVQADAFLKANDHIISILAYAAQGPGGGRRLDLEDAIDKAKLWDIKRSFVSNPLLVVSRNRADVTLTVVPDPGTQPEKPKRRGLLHL